MNEPPTALLVESCYTHCITGLGSRHTGTTGATVAAGWSSIVTLIITISNFFLSVFCLQVTYGLS